MMRTFLLIVALVALSSVPVMVVTILCVPHSIVINHPAPPPDTSCKCPPPPTQAEIEAQEKAEYKARLKRYMIDHFGGCGPSTYWDDPDASPTPRPRDGMGNEIP